MLGPIALCRSRAGRSSAPRNDPRRGQIALLPEIRAQDPDVEILRFHSPEPPAEHAQRLVNGDSLMVAGRSTRPDRAGVSAVLPEERSDPGPVASREPSGVAAEQLVDRVLVPSGAGRRAILDPASCANQETDAEDRETGTGQTDRWCVSSWSRSSWFSRRVLGVSSAWAQRTSPSGPIST